MEKFDDVHLLTKKLDPIAWSWGPRVSQSRKSPWRC